MAAPKPIVFPNAAPPLLSALARHRQLSPSANVRVSPLCLGTMGFGEAHKGHMGETSKETAFEILDAFVTAGGNFIDSANNYQNEQSEILLGEWMALRKNRQTMVVSTKYGASYKIYDRAKYGCQSNWGGSGTKSMRNSLQESLEKLQTTYVDVFYLHFWDYSTSIPELMHSLNDLVSSGKVHYLGISDTPAWVVSKANQYARDHGLRQFSVYQGMWNASMRDFEREIIPMCLDEGMGINPYGILGAGRFQTATSFAEREEANPGRKGKIPTDREKAVSAVLEAVALRKGTSLTTVALAYCMAKAPYVFPVVGGRKVEHLMENIGALSLRLSEEDIRDIEKVEPCL
ncbi:Norsolorinic acid reductase B [Lachnellula suecica]|uniref:Norsolorinic acid reductase B n=1 Tax=Lachnellula suecica TaxID=602035 RepID=A0A8T9CGA5_9HELO|nr:Norsolorinic acid reductase B [Lachnellula suecica]